ncbi:FAD-dependent oxidoreductase [Nannocystis pusilla]|uniref:FAD-dependent oxidoreductase n=1 Tax=Nannocystis pusilla TaxID=889268 RepID=UPI003B80758A
MHSRIRTAGDFGARVRPPGIAYLRALVDVEAAQGVEAWTGAGIFGSFAVDGGTYFFASAGTRACRHAIAARDLEALRAVWARAYPPSIPLLGAVRRFDDLIFNRVIRVDCQRWVDGRLALLGDAAHAMSPNLGQGPTAPSSTPRCCSTSCAAPPIWRAASTPTSTGAGPLCSESPALPAAWARSPSSPTPSPAGCATACSCRWPPASAATPPRS